MAKKIWVIAGEASGDLHGANLIHALRTQVNEPLEIHGVGGDKIKETGAKDFFDLAHFHVTGITDALKRYGDYKNAAKIVLANVERSKPDLVVLIDNPGFNLHLAEKIHAMRIPIVYYIAPQIWAWNAKRVHKIKKYVKKVLVVFEFEKEIYEKNGVPVECVGHPLNDFLAGVRPDTRWLNKDRAPLVALMPGSRKGELKMLLETMLGAAAEIRKTIPNARFVVIKAPTMPKATYDRFLANAGVPVTLVEENSYGTIKAADLVIVCSGTATLECALLGVPMIITNKGTFLNYLAARALIRVKYLGLPNLILDRQAVPELLQFDATPQKLARQAVHILKDTEGRQIMIKALWEVKEKLGGPGANRRTAQEVLKAL
jgi:lipid-A-disaccharide synthase